MIPLVTWVWPETALSLGTVLLVTLLLRVVLRRTIRIGVGASLSLADRHRDAKGATERVLTKITGAADDRHQARVRTARSDALAAKLLELGAHDLEIVAPTLETAFTALTQDAGE